MQTRLKILFHKIRIQLAFIVIGLLSLLWFLFRVIPKPSRAAYPCQKIAAPMASTFLLWLTGWISSHVFFRQIKKKIFHHSSVAYMLLFFITGLFCLSMYLIHPTFPIHAVGTQNFIPTDAPNQPTGVSRGIYPGRVVWMHDSGATSWDGEHGYWWEDENTDSVIVTQMLTKSVQNLTGKSDLSEAWDALFHYFNAHRNHTDIGYRAGEKITIKLNLVQNVAHDNGGNKCFAAPQLLYALISQLAHQAGVPDSCVTCYDATAYIPGSIYDRCKDEFPNMHFVDWEGGQGREKYIRDTSVSVHWSQPLTLEKKGGNPTYLVKCLTEADYVINLANLKGHMLTGVTFCAKNHFGSLSADYQGQPHKSAPQAAGVHPYIAVSDVDLGSEDWQFSGREMETYNPIVDLMGHEHVGEKTLLFLVDGLYAVRTQSSAVDETMKWQSAPFNNDWTSSLFASQDGVAIESVCLDFLRNEPTMTEVHGMVDNYLHEAALANDPPSGAFYDPEGDGTRLPSLGVHEHWNNAVDKQYSVNLGTGPGIELLQNPSFVQPSYSLSVCSQYGTVTGTGVYEANSEVIVQLSSTIIDSGNGTRYVFDGWVGEGDGAYTGNDSIFSLTLDGDITQTARWKTQYLLTISVQNDSGGTVNPSGEIWADADSSVEIMANPNSEAGYSFAGWQGDESGSENPLTLIIDGPKTITAEFEQTTGVDRMSVPTVFALKQNYPNPFNPETMISFDLPEPGQVVIQVFDLMGRKVRTLIDTQKQPGSYQLIWDGRNDAGLTVSSGTYVYVMRCGDYQRRMKAVFLK